MGKMFLLEILWGCPKPQQNTLLILCLGLQNTSSRGLGDIMIKASTFASVILL